MKTFPGKSRLLPFWQRLSANSQGAIWMLVGCFLFSVMSLGIKHLGGHINSFQIAFLRAFLGFLAFLPFVYMAGFSNLKTKKLQKHLLRGCIGISAMFSVFYAITQMPLADAVALTFTRALFLILLAVLFLGETIRWRRWLATAAGFVGVVVMVQAGPEVGFAAGIALLGAFLVALVSVLIKQLSNTESPTTIMFYFGLIGSIVSFGPALYVWVPISWNDLIILIIASTFGSAGNYCVINAFALGEATAVSPFDYSRLIFSGILAFFFFSEVPDVWMIVGAGIIIISTLYIARREALANRKITPPEMP